MLTFISYLWKDEHNLGSKMTVLFAHPQQVQQWSQLEDLIVEREELQTENKS